MKTADGRHIGRAKGVPNRVSCDVRVLVQQALSEVGGVAYLVRQAEENPRGFLALVARLMPSVLTGHDDAPLFATMSDDDLEQQIRSRLIASGLTAEQIDVVLAEDNARGDYDA